MLSIKIIRKKISYAYQRDPSKGFDWHNNDANNSLDDFWVFDDIHRIMVCSVQTVSNAEGLIDGVHFYDTIKPGRFFLRAFVDPRAFKCQPHGIVGARTLHGDLIVASLGKNGLPDDDDSTTATNKSRWLMHDLKNHDGVDTRVAWSAGCIVVPDRDLDSFNTLLSGHGVKKFDLIPVDLLDEE
jgi:hypothetical protein